MDGNEEFSEADIEELIEAHVKYKKTFSDVEKSLEAKNFSVLEESISDDGQLEVSDRENLLKSGKKFFYSNTEFSEGSFAYYYQ
jgi:hypothetical protein